MSAGKTSSPGQLSKGQLSKGQLSKGQLSKGQSPQVLSRLSRFDTADLGPHASALIDELRAAASNRPLGLSCVILAATIIDVVQHEEAGPAGYLDGMAFAYAGNKAALGWLRGRRNTILHHEGPADGLMGEGPAPDWHLADAEKAILTLLDYLADLDLRPDHDV